LNDEAGSESRWKPFRVDDSGGKHAVSDRPNGDTDDLGQSIKNHDEVALALKDSQYEKFLDPQ